MRIQIILGTLFKILFMYLFLINFNWVNYKFTPRNIKNLCEQVYIVFNYFIIYDYFANFRCEQCNKSFTTTCSLRTHNLSYHAPEEELLHTCDSCPRKFARRNLLELHKPVHIPKEEWTFFCTKCPTQKA